MPGVKRVDHTKDVWSWKIGPSSNLDLLGIDMTALDFHGAMAFVPSARNLRSQDSMLTLCLA